MKRREFVQITASATTTLLADGCMSFSRVQNAGGFEEADIAELQKAFEEERADSASLARYYRDRIARLDAAGPKLNSVIELNPEGIEIARRLDVERRAKGGRGPLHGIPVLVKDNLDTHDQMMTTAGSLALLGSMPRHDSTVVERLRAAGAVILGKTNLSEWANFRGHHSTSGWSGRGGQTVNPYVLDRNPSGSSSGSAVAVSANLCAFAIGTETDGSIVSPASHCGIVGLKPTVGAISRAGIIPISQSQDTAGPMTRTVRDAAIVFGVLAGPDSRDPVTEASRGKVHSDYTQFLSEDGLKGARIGIGRQFFSKNSRTSKVFEQALEILKRAGAELIDPADLPTHGKFGDAEGQVLLYEFKAGLNAYLQNLGPSAPVRSLAEVIAFNQKNRSRELLYFGQETMIDSQEKPGLTDKPYLEALELSKHLAGKEGIDAIMDEHRLDAIIASTNGPACRIDHIYGDRSEGASSSPAAVAGYPSITVPAGEVQGLPIGVSFFGRAWSEPVLLKLAFAFEQESRARRKPAYRTTLSMRPNEVV
jgi:amidase